MRKLFALTAVFGMLTIGASSMLMAQENDATQTEDATLEITVDENATMEEAAIADPTVLEDESQIESTSFHAALKQKFIEGGAFWMLPIALCLIFGLAIAIERVIYLNLASTNNKKLIAKVEEALENGGIEATKEVCRNTRGPVASIFYQGLCRYDQGVDMVEKSVVTSPSNSFVTFSKTGESLYCDDILPTGYNMLSASFTSTEYEAVGSKEPSDSIHSPIEVWSPPLFSIISS